MNHSHLQITNDVVFRATTAGFDLMHSSIEAFWHACDQTSHPPPVGEWRHVFDLAIAEVGGNIVRHAYSTDPGGQIRLRLRRGQSHVTACFVDMGRAYTSRDVDPVSLGDDVFDLPESGWGLHIALISLDDLRYRRLISGENVWRLVKREYAPAEAYN